MERGAHLFRNGSFLQQLHLILFFPSHESHHKIDNNVTTMKNTGDVAAAAEPDTDAVRVIVRSTVCGIDMS